LNAISPLFSREEERLLRRLLGSSVPEFAVRFGAEGAIKRVEGELRRASSRRKRRRQSPRRASPRALRAETFRHHRRASAQRRPPCSGASFLSTAPSARAAGFGVASVFLGAVGRKPATSREGTPARDAMSAANSWDTLRRPPADQVPCSSSSSSACGRKPNPFGQQRLRSTNFLFG
jgi:hypothetical protein